MPSLGSCLVCSLPLPLAACHSCNAMNKPSSLAVRPWLKSGRSHGDSDSQILQSAHQETKSHVNQQTSKNKPPRTHHQQKAINNNRKQQETILRYAQDLHFENYAHHRRQTNNLPAVCRFLITVSGKLPYIQHLQKISRTLTPPFPPPKKLPSPFSVPHREPSNILKRKLRTG